MRTLLLGLVLFLNLTLGAQNSVQIDGYVYESGNRGFLQNILIEVFDQYSDTLVGRANSDVNGYFTLPVSIDQKFTLKASHEYFYEKSIAIESIGKGEGDKIFVKLELNRSPGYLFEITMSEEREDNSTPVDAIKSSKIEVYNNTTKELVLKLDDYLNPDFKVHLKKGNHYTLMIRKNGFLTKRMEAFVDVKGCILCFEGIGEVRPGVTDNLTEKNSFGTLLANVELERVYPGKEIKVNTIYYAPGTHELSSTAKLELDRLELFMMDNPNLIIELGSHTDARGNIKDNTALSQKRADTAVDYILRNGNIDQSRLVAKGYGFSNILNHCKPGVKCTKEEHGVNRRTELKLIGVLNENGFVEKSLASMKQIEHMDELLAEIEKEGTIAVPSDREVKKNEDLSRREVNKINEEFENESKNIRSAVKETVKEIVGDTEERVMLQVDHQEDFDKAVDSKESIEELVDESSISNEMTTPSNEMTDNEELLEEEIVNKEIANTSEVILEDKRVDTMIDEKNEVSRKVELDSKYEIISGDENWMKGHKIVVFESKEELPESHEIYKRFKKFKTLKSPISNKILYIIGDFPSEKLAKNYLESKIRKEYSGAYLIAF